ncbi:hypothetical protein [Paraburkholderia sp. J8-2]|uniref:hypothetical protein n=1 Tax=Paraburkholderia sp. J8-2 TaxID=2805440 RepID=UPI002AB7A59A|nr:hypothetical protein [Paraburkholderia sp. J8-2]
MLLLNRTGAGSAIGEVASEWWRTHEGTWICTAAEAPVKWMLGKEAYEVKDHLVAHGLAYRWVKLGSLLGVLVEILSGGGNGGHGVPVAAPREEVRGLRWNFRDEFGVEPPQAWTTVMAWCDGFLGAGVEVFGSGREAKRADRPRGIVEANRTLHATVSSRVLWLGAMVGVSFGLDLDSGLCVGVNDSDRSVWMATRTPGDLLAWLAGLAISREVALGDPPPESEWPTHVADVRDSGQAARKTPEVRYAGRPGEQYRYGL